jgi:hypothetical protein
MRLNLIGHRFRSGLVSIGEGGAEGGQLRVGVKLAGLVVPTTLLRTAIGELDEIAAMLRMMRSYGKVSYPSSPKPKAASTQRVAIVSR